MLHHQAQTLATPPPLDMRSHALFLDLDGTLVEFAAHPEQVVASDDLRLLLKRLALAMNGAVALITGRTIASADAVLDGALVHVAGVHGLERRAGNVIECAHRDVSPIEAAITDARTLAANGALNASIEAKGAALALHYRSAPQFADVVRRAAAELARRHGLSIVEGKMVIELKLGERTKADAVLDFLAEEPFRGRVPIAIGDDLTDEDAFRVVSARGGYAILVGEERPTTAGWRLAGTAAVYDWLAAGLAS